jgi:protein-S-isoprenylcysteine O-methyltransferase Ste14
MVRQIRSLVLPFIVLVVVPFLLLFDFARPRLRISQPCPAAQIAVGSLLCAAGLILLAATIRLFIRRGRGTLAPWDPPAHLIVEGPYAYTRNPMISGVAFVVLGEAVLCWSLPVLIWFAAVVLVNSVYFKLSEEPGLAARFADDYQEYRRHVPMWVPRLRPWRK